MLEDDFIDIFRKARRGTGISEADIAKSTGLDLHDIQHWASGDEVPGPDEARAIARILRLDPGKFADSAARTWEPHVREPSYVRHHPHDPHPSNGYIFFLESGEGGADGKTAALIDPAGIPANLLRAIAEGPYALRYILISHKHADHCDATADVARAFPQAQIVMHRSDAPAIGALAARALHPADNEAVPFGDGAEIRVMHTPGHTDGSICFLFRSTVFSGDTLFAGSIGGVFGDKFGYDDILRSIREKLFVLDDATVVMPGHGPPTTIAEEKAHNPFFVGM